MNAGIVNDKELVALRKIGTGDEIRFDYSTTMDERSFTMECLCGAPGCRGTVGDFVTLPEQVKAQHIARGTVMGFIARRAFQRA